MEQMKRGRPKSKEPTRNKHLAIRVSTPELEELQKVCIKHDIRYIDVLLKGVEYWSRK